MKKKLDTFFGGKRYRKKAIFYVYEGKQPLFSITDDEKPKIIHMYGEDIYDVS